MSEKNVEVMELIETLYSMVTEMSLRYSMR